MRIFEGFERNIAVLFFVFLVVKFQLPVDSMSIDHHFDIRNFGEECQCRLVYVVVNKSYRLFGTFDQVVDKHIRIKYLPVKEDTLLWLD